MLVDPSARLSERGVNLKKKVHFHKLNYLCVIATARPLQKCQRSHD